MKQEIMIVVVRVCRPCQDGWRCLSVLLVDVGIDVGIDAGIDAGIGIEIETIVNGKKGKTKIITKLVRLINKQTR